MAKTTHGGARTGSGRPRIYKNLAQPTSILLEAKMLLAIDRRARKMGINRSDVIRIAVGEWLAR